MEILEGVGGADIDRHPGRLKARGGTAGEVKKEWSAGISSILTTDEHGFYGSSGLVN